RGHRPLLPRHHGRAGHRHPQRLRRRRGQGRHLAEADLQGDRRPDRALRRPSHRDLHQRLLRPAQEDAGARDRQRGVEPVPVPLRGHHRSRERQGDVRARARGALHHAPDVLPPADQPESRAAPADLRGRPRRAGLGLATKPGRPRVGVEVRPVRPDEAAALKALRLRALAEAPLAFGSTLAREAAFTDDLWAERAAATDERCVFVALDEGRWVGLATALAHAPDQPGPSLGGMFVDPAYRGRGIVDALLDAAAGWVREHGGRTLYLWATSTNTPAIRA